VLLFNVMHVSLVEENANIAVRVSGVLILTQFTKGKKESSGIYLKSLQG